MSQAKLIKQDQDFRFNKIINVKVHPVTTSDRLSIGLLLGTDDIGLQVFDINDLVPYFWSGDSWIQISSSSNFDYFVIDEIPTGNIDGSNSYFFTLNQFIPGKLDVFLNGLRQTIITDFVTTGTNTIILNFSPNIGELLTVNYIKQ